MGCNNIDIGMEYVLKASVCVCVERERESERGEGLGSKLN